MVPGARAWKELTRPDALRHTRALRAQACKPIGQPGQNPAGSASQAPLRSISFHTCWWISRIKATQLCKAGLDYHIKRDAWKVQLDFLVYKTFNLLLTGFPADSVVKRHRRQAFSPWMRKIPWRKKWQPTPVFSPGEIPWTEEPGGPQTMGSQRTGRNWVTTQQQTRSGSCLGYSFTYSWPSFSAPESLCGKYVKLQRCNQKSKGIGRSP